MELDYFQLISQKIISELVRAVSERTVTSGEVTNWVRQRRQSFWYGEFNHLYEAIDYASRFMAAMDTALLEMDSLSDGITRYTQNWYVIDQIYRKFIWHKRQSNQASLMNALAEKVENLYSNNYLLTVNNAWQQQVDQTSIMGCFPG